MKSISSFGNNNQNSINDMENHSESNGYKAGYLSSKDNKCDEVSFTGIGKKVKEKGLRGLILGLAAALGLSGCVATSSIKGTTSASGESTAVTETADAEETTVLTDSETVSLLDLDDTIPVVSIISTVEDEDEEVEVKQFYNVLAITDDAFPETEQVNSTTTVVRTSSNEADECTTLLEAINKQYTEPFINNGGDPGEVTDAALDQIAREIIENNEEMQELIAEYYGVDDWMEADMEDILNDSLYEMGILEFNTPDVVEIHGISTDSPLYERTESSTTLYSTEDDTITLDNSIESIEDIYEAFASVYKDADGNSASTAAASIAAWLAIRDNQYNEAFDGKINNDGDRTVAMLLETLQELEDGETLELNLPSTFGVNITASGKSIDDVSLDDAYYIVNEMTPTASSVTLDASETVESDTDTEGLYDFIDIATLYSDPDTLETYAEKIQDEDGNWVFTYNTNVADLNAKLYSLYEQFAYDHLEFFAASQYIDVDGENTEYEFGVFDVMEGYEDVVEDLIAEGDYDTAKQYLVFNLDRFVSGSFYNEDGTLKTDGDLVLSLEQYLYVNDGEGTAVSIEETSEDTVENDDTDISEDNDNNDNDTTVIIDNGDTDTDVDNDDTDDGTTDDDTSNDDNGDTDTDTDNGDTDTDTDVDVDTDTDTDTDDGGDTDDNCEDEDEVIPDMDGDLNDNTNPVDPGTGDGDTDTNDNGDTDDGTTDDNTSNDDSCEDEDEVMPDMDGDLNDNLNPDPEIDDDGDTDADTDTNDTDTNTDTKDDNSGDIDDNGDTNTDTDNGSDTDDGTTGDDTSNNDNSDSNVDDGTTGDDGASNDEGTTNDDSCEDEDEVMPDMDGDLNDNLNPDPEIDDDGDSDVDTNDGGDSSYVDVEGEDGSDLDWESEVSSDSSYVDVEGEDGSDLDW